MSPPYVSILLQQPADGDTVFIRRFTRDPPVRGLWDATTQEFTLAVAASMTIVGGTYAGTWPLTFSPNLDGTGQPGWFNKQGSVYLMILFAAGTYWRIFQNNFANVGYDGNTHFPDPYAQTETSFTTEGAPGWTGPTSMTTAIAATIPLIIPAALVQAWRPL